MNTIFRSEKMKTNKIKSHRVTFVMSDAQVTELKIMCVLTKKTMSAFLRVAIQDKIKEVKRISQIGN